MAVNLRGRSFLTLKDFEPEEIRYLLELSKDLKAKKRMGIKGKVLEGKSIVLLFDKTSTRTRCAFETAAFEEGGSVTFLTNSQFQVKESLEDSAKVLGRYYDGIEYRGFKQEIVEGLAKYSGVPVWNGLTDVDHPTQVLADFLTLEEHSSKKLNQMKLVFSGDTRNNMGYALMYGAAKMGMHFVALGPKELTPDPEILSEMQEYSKKTGAKIEYTDNVDEAVKGADAIYADVWVSMGEKVDYAERVRLLEPYRVTVEMLEKTGNRNVLFMHCLPSFHDFKTDQAREMKEKHNLDIREVTDEVFRSRHSVVFDEAENRLHTIKAVIVATIGA